MAKLDTRSYPELSRLMSRRDRERNQILHRRELGDSRGGDILEFWDELAERIEQEDDLDNVEAILREIRADIDMLRAVQQTLEITKSDEHMAQVSRLLQLIRVLLDLYEKVKKWHRHLRDRARAYYLSVNLAIPSKAKEKREQEKDKKKKGQAKSRRAVEEAHKTPKGKKPARPRRRPDKKMQP